MYTLVNRGEDSSVYKYITKLLVKGSAWSGKWKLGPKDYARFNLMFGERQTRVLDYTRIGRKYSCIYHDFRINYITIIVFPNLIGVSTALFFSNN